MLEAMIGMAEPDSWPDKVNDELVIVRTILKGPGGMGQQGL